PVADRGHVPRPLRHGLDDANTGLPGLGLQPRARGRRADRGRVARPGRRAPLTLSLSAQLAGSTDRPGSRPVHALLARRAARSLRTRLPSAGVDVVVVAE